MLRKLLLVWLTLLSLAGCMTDAFDAPPPAQDYTRQLLRDRLNPDRNFSRGRGW